MTPAGWAAVCVALVLAVAAAALGVLLRRNRAALAEALAARRTAIDAQQRIAELAVAAERLRIVREMHDVLAHSLAVMIAQADGGSYVVEDTDAARRAFVTIAETGRGALADTRRVLGLLRAGAEEAPALTPPEDASLDALVERARAAGMTAALIRVGHPRPLPAGIRMALYRICQESLTNVLKHAGDGARVVVTESWLDADLVLTVSNDGGTGAPASGDPLGGLGLGLIGMRERAELVGGTLDAAASETGFRVRASLPIPAGADADQAADAASDKEG